MSLIIAQLSDSHLFSDIQQLHAGANVYQHLKKVLDDIAANSAITHIIFTGDLTQDHSAASYRLFSDMVHSANITQPFYYLCGNHDEPEQMSSALNQPPFTDSNVIETNQWQVFLLASKSETPAGFVSVDELEKLTALSHDGKNKWLFMHHHPINVGYFIDRHPLVNQDAFWQSVSRLSKLQGIACGHVHQGLLLSKEQTMKACDVLTCPATSIQFDPTKDTVSALGIGPGYRLIELHDDGRYDTRLVYL